MATKRTAGLQVLKVGDLVKIRNSGFPQARIVELRGPLGPGGAEVYRVCVRRKPKPMYVEVLGDQLVVAGAAVTKARRTKSST
jgi:hypothetical protein